MKTSSFLPEPGFATKLDIFPASGISDASGMTQEPEDSPVTIPSHPLGLKPSGNQYTAVSNARDSLGEFQRLTDEALVVLLEYLESHLLRNLGATCKALYAFCRLDDLWKALFIESHEVCKQGNFQWHGTWRSTYLGLSQDQLSQVRCENVFSDVLYRPFLCTHTPLSPYTNNIPPSNAIARLPNLTATEFLESWSDKPFILTQTVPEWPVYSTWDTTHLLEKYSTVKFRAESVDWSLATYVEYMASTTDESPLYLFDRSFMSKMTLNTDPSSTAPLDYWPPTCLGEDLFDVLGPNRPDSKWLIIGPARSGSTYHKDPNATSAWNAVLRGSKYWIMFPSATPPPGVYVSADQSEVTSPLSIAEWLLGFHAEARKTPGCVEGICGEGEVLHVPSGWWHLVVNLAASIAITQNFVPRSHLVSVLMFLKDNVADQVSGFRKDISDPYGLFVEGMREKHTELLEQALAELERKAEGRKRKWDAAVGGVDGKSSRGGGFSFGFGDDSDEEVS